MKALDWCDKGRYSTGEKGDPYEGVVVKILPETSEEIGLFGKDSKSVDEINTHDNGLNLEWKRLSKYLKEDPIEWARRETAKTLK